MTRFTAGWNIPGYLPESAPTTFDTWHEALAYLVETVDLFWEQDGDRDDFDADAQWLDLHTQLGLAGSDTHFTSVNGNASLVFWIVPATCTCIPGMPALDTCPIHGVLEVVNDA